MSSPESTIELDISDILAQLTPSGRLEWDLAKEKATNAKLTEMNVKFSALIAELRDKASK